jgi:site-specific DNA-methyltransferase (adenine-specific)
MGMAVDRIRQGDCIKGMSKLEAGSVDLVFADPPFNIGYEYDVYDDMREADEYLDWCREWISGVKRVLKPDGTFWLAIGDEFAAELKVLCTRKLGFHCRSWVIWFYTFGVHCKYKFTRSHAHLFHFVKDKKRFTFNSLDVRVPSAREIVYGDKGADPDGRVPDDTWMMAPVLPPEVPTRDGFILRPQDIPERFPATSDTWFFSRVAGTFKERAGFHGCQMPEQLLGRIIRGCSKEGELVFDPFAGSGTTPAVARKLARRYLGFELSKKYVALIRKRLAAVQPGDPLDGPENAVRSAPRTRDGRRLKRARGPVSVRTSESPILTKANVSLGQVAVANGELATAIAEAFLASHQGWSSDRVLADRSMNESFLNNCRLLGIPGDAKDWNHLLLNVRKRGGLKAIATTRRTTQRRETMEAFLHASEIAWRRICNDNACSLDDILCDPALADRFDTFAARIAPGFTSFQYRWAALSLRKDASEGESLKDEVPARLAGDRTPLAATSRLPANPGHYLVLAGDNPFFVGFTNSLRDCEFFRPVCIHAALGILGQDVSDADVVVRRRAFERPEEVRSHSDAGPRAWRFARRAKLIEVFKPIGNIPTAA